MIAIRRLLKPLTSDAGHVLIDTAYRVGAGSMRLRVFRYTKMAASG